MKSLTPERKAKLESVLNHRQPDLGILMEHINDPHNISACLRSCDAVGIQDIHIIQDDPEKRLSRFTGKRSSSSANKWLTLHYHEETSAAINVMRNKYNKIYTTHLGSESISIYDIDFTENVAIVFGNERYGVSEEALNLCDANIVIPQVGMIQSLNISVACAITVYEAFRQRTVAGLYKHSRLDKSEYKKMMLMWTENKFHKKIKNKELK